jgi:hypothetical protein
MLTLQAVFGGADRRTLMSQIFNAEPLAPRKLDKSIPIELETITLKALEKNPSQRYASAGEMAADLRRFLEDRPIRARRPTLLDHTRKWLRRHPSVIAFLLTLLVLGIAGLATTTALIDRERVKEQQRALEAQERFELARRSADDMIRIAEEELGNHSDDLALRRRLLESAFAYYQEFIKLRHDDPDAQADLKVTRDRVQSILDDLVVIKGAERHMLVGEPAVQADLKCTDGQREKLNAITREIIDHGPPGRSPPRTNSGQPGKELLSEMKAHDVAIAEILTVPQMHRLGQIALQIRGVRAFNDPDIVSTLKLTSEQREQLRWLAPGPGRKDSPPGGEGFRHSPDKVGPPGGRMARDFKGRMQEALDVLTPLQRRQWIELIGEPFTGTLSPRPGRPRP